MVFLLWEQVVRVLPFEQRVSMWHINLSDVSAGILFKIVYIKPLDVSSGSLQLENFPGCVSTGMSVFMSRQQLYEPQAPAHFLYIISDKKQNKNKAKQKNKLFTLLKETEYTSDIKEIKKINKSLDSIQDPVPSTRTNTRRYLDGTEKSPRGPKSFKGPK